MELGVYDIYTNGFCTHFPWNNAPVLGNTVDAVVYAIDNVIAFRCDEFATEDGVRFVNWLKSEGVKVMYRLAAPTEIPLDADTLTAYAALHSNKPSTLVRNDAGAGQKAAYVADTKLYIDNKFTEVTNAVVAIGGVF